MEIVKEPSPMVEARDDPSAPTSVAPEPAPAADTNNTSTENKNATEQSKIPATAEEPPKPAKPARSRPMINKSLLAGALGGAGAGGKKEVAGGKRAAKSIFGVVVGTLKKADLEDKKRNATEAAKKRAIIDSRLQSKIAKETATVRRLEENKRDRHAANRREEDLALKESLHKLRQERGRLLGTYLRTDDDFLKDDEDDGKDDGMDMDDDMTSKPRSRSPSRSRSKSPRGSRSRSRTPRAGDASGAGEMDVENADGAKDSNTAPSEPPRNPRAARDALTKERQRLAKEKAKVDLLFAPARGHPPAIYYLPKVLLPSQRRFVDKRKEAITAVLEKEEKEFIEHRMKEVVEIRAIRKKVDEEDEKLKLEKRELEGAGKEHEQKKGKENGHGLKGGDGDVDMDVEEGGRNRMEEDGDEAVEY